MKPVVIFAATLAVVFATSTAGLAGARCKYAAGALPSESPGKQIHGDQIPIDHIVVVMQENRSFDHYFGQLHSEGQPKTAAEPTTPNPNPVDATMPIAPFHQDLYCEVADLDHSWSGSHKEWDNGKMDGFTAQNVNSADPTGSRTMGWHDSADIPFYYSLASTFAMADRYFCSVLSQTFPNRFFLLAGTSFGHIANDFPQDCQQPCDPATAYDQRSIFNLMDEATPQVTWKIYFEEIPFAALFAYVRNSDASHLAPMSQFLVDAAAGNLPQVAFIDPTFIASSDTEDDEHPTANIQLGQQHVAQVVDALMTSPQWDRSALFLTYDEHGGFYDHVAPPPACIPDDIPPMLAATDEPGQFDRYGFRVPFVAVSPWARPHYVGHKVYDHTSILRFIENRFDLPALTARDANARPLLELFDFTTPSFVSSPTLAPATVDQAHFDAPECVEGKGSGGL